jgi:hypothetical protein
MQRYLKRGLLSLMDGIEDNETELSILASIEINPLEVFRVH